LDDDTQLDGSYIHAILLLYDVIGMLRYKVDFQSLQADDPLDDIDLDEY